MMSIGRLVVAGVTVALAAAAPLQAQRSSGDSFTWHGAMSAGSTLQIRNINGPVRVERASGGQAEVVAEKQYTKGDPSRVVIEAIRYGAGNQSAIVCAMWDPAARCTESGESGSGNNRDRTTDDNDLAVHFTIRLPDGVNATLSTVNGDVEVSGATAVLVATTVNGNVTVEAGGAIRATTVNGNVEASLGSSDDDDVTLTSVNGSVTAMAPAGLNALFTASTVSGEIQSDFPLTVRGRIGMQSVSTTIGSGGRKLLMTTVSGSVVLKRD